MLGSVLGRVFIFIKMLIFRAVFILLVLAILSIGVYMIALQSPMHTRCNKNKTERFEYVDNNNIEAGIKMPELVTEQLVLSDKDKLLINKTNIFDLIYPIGSVYITNSSTVNPGTLFGVGKWKKIEDSFLWCKGSKTNLDNVTGSLTITTNHLPKHNHTINLTSGTGSAHTHSFTGNEITGSFGSADIAGVFRKIRGRDPTGCFKKGKYWATWSITHDKSYGGAYDLDFSATPSGTIGNESKHTHSIKGDTGEIGEGQTFIPPFRQIYAWERIQ